MRLIYSAWGSLPVYKQLPHAPQFRPLIPLMDEYQPKVAGYSVGGDPKSFRRLTGRPG